MFDWQSVKLNWTRIVMSRHLELRSKLIWGNLRLFYLFIHRIYPPHRKRVVKRLFYMEPCALYSWIYYTWIFIAVNGAALFIQCGTMILPICYVRMPFAIPQAERVFFVNIYRAFARTRFFCVFFVSFSNVSDTTILVWKISRIRHSIGYNANNKNKTITFSHWLPGSQ